MTVLEMRSEIADYKKKNCPPAPKTKAGLIKVCEHLGLRTTKADTKVYKKFGMTVPPNLQPKYTKKELIAKIVERNGRRPFFYKKWSQADLKEFYARM